MCILANLNSGTINMEKGYLFDVLISYIWTGTLPSINVDKKLYIQK
jgi:hypothetical protein